MRTRLAGVRLSGMPARLASQLWRELNDAARSRIMVPLGDGMGVPVAVRFIGQQTKANRPVRRVLRLDKIFGDVQAETYRLLGEVRNPWSGDPVTPEVAIVIPESNLYALETHCRSRNLRVTIGGLLDLLVEQ